MQNLLEYLSQKQLIHTITLLEENKKTEAVHYITEHSTLDEAQALELTEQIVREYEVVIKHPSTTPDLNDEASEIDLVSPPLEIPNHPNLSAPSEAELAAHRVHKTPPARQVEKRIWAFAAIAVLLLLLVWFLL